METATDVLAMRRRRAELEHVVRTNSVRTLCQPIVSLESGRVAGFEALSRPAAQPPLDAPDAFLLAAHKLGLLSEAEAGWRRAAVERFAGALPNDALLFVNVWPGSLLSGALRTSSLLDLVRRHGMRPQRMVLELMEGQTIADFGAMRRSLSGLRAEGFQVAIDDVGAGPSSLQSIVELRPHFIKLDRWLARDIANDAGRRSMVEAIVGFAHRTRALVVAEGIETAEELQTFIELGVDFGQGFLLGRPSAVPAGPAPSLVEHIRRGNAARRAARAQAGAVRAGEIAVVTPTVAPATPGTQIVDMFESNDLLDVVAVVEERRVIGVVTRLRLLSRLMGQYGRTMMARRVAADLCGPATIIGASEPIRAAGRLALQRPAGSQLDPIVVVDEGEFAGVVSITDLLQQLLTEEVAEARMANPLTGLPGNQAIRRFVESHSAVPGLVLLYADIDNFKHFNDRFGFALGDQAIARLGALLAEIPSFCAQESFVGHVGGDDFVAVVHDGDLPAVRRHVTQALAGRWFDPDGLCEADRLTVTVGGAPLSTAASLRYEERAALVARVKTELKRRGGDCFTVFADGEMDEELALAA